LPKVFSIGSVSKSQDSIFLINRKDRSDLYFFFLNHIGMDRFVALVTANTGPSHGILLSANLKGVGEGDLFPKGESVCGTKK